MGLRQTTMGLVNTSMPSACAVGRVMPMRTPMGCATMRRFWVAPFHLPATTTKRPRKTTAAVTSPLASPSAALPRMPATTIPKPSTMTERVSMPTSPTTAMATASTIPTPMACVMSWKSQAVWTRLPATTTKTPRRIPAIVSTLKRTTIAMATA